MQPTCDRSRPHGNSQKQADPDGELNHSDQVAKKCRMRQDQIGENRLIKAHRCPLGIALQILLKAAMGEFRAKQFVLAEQKKKTCGGHAYDSQSFGKKRGIVAHEFPIMSRSPSLRFFHETRLPRGMARRELTARAVVQDVLLQGIQFAAQVINAPLQHVTNGKHSQQVAIVVHDRQVAEVPVYHGN